MHVDVGETDQQRRPRLVRKVVARKERSEPLVLLRNRSPRPPEEVEHVSGTRGLDRGGVAQAIEHRAEVVLLVVVPGEDLRLSGSEPVRIVRLQPLEVPAGVAERVLSGSHRPSSSRSRAYSRRVSSRKKRSSPRAFSRLWSRSAASWSRSAPVIASAASRVKEPRKTESDGRGACASGSRRSWLHSIVARSVRCRSGRSIAPPAAERAPREALQQGGRRKASPARRRARSRAGGCPGAGRPQRPFSSASIRAPTAAARLTKSSTAASSGRARRELSLGAQVQWP